MVTKEQIVGMTKEQLMSVDFREVWPQLQDMEYMTQFKADYDRIKEMFLGSAGHWAQRIRQAYDKKEEGIDVLVLVFSREPALTQIFAWSQCTSIGIDDIDYCKFVHKHFASPILNLFGTVKD